MCFAVFKNIQIYIDICLNALNAASPVVARKHIKTRRKQPNPPLRFTGLLASRKKILGSWVDRGGFKMTQFR